MKVTTSDRVGVLVIRAAETFQHAPALSSPLSMHALNALPRWGALSHVEEACRFRLPLRPVTKTHLAAPSTGRVHKSQPVLRRVVASASESSSVSAPSFTEVQALPVREDDGALRPVPALPGIYAFYDKEDELQYIGLSRKVIIGIYIILCKCMKPSLPQNL